MADRYVVAAGGNWNATGTWAATDGGAGGETVPGATDNVFITATSGNLVHNATGSCQNYDATGHTGTISGTGALTVTGATFKLSSAGTYTATGLRTITGANSGGTVTITRAGKTTSQAYTVNGSGITFNLADNLNIGTNTLTISNGTFNSQGFDITCGQFDSSGTTTRTITLTGSDVTVSTNIFVDNTNLTWATPDTLIIVKSAASSPTSLTIYANVRFDLVQISRAVGAGFSGMQISAPSGTPDIGELEIVGVNSGLFYNCLICFASNCLLDDMVLPEGCGLISSSVGSARTITTSTGGISFDGCFLQDIDLDGGPAIATNSVDLGGNTGITFQNFGPATHEIVGITKDDAGAPLPSCLVVAFKEDGGVLKEVSRVTSDGTTGAYTLPTPDADANAYTILATKTSSYRGDAMNGITPTVP